MARILVTGVNGFVGKHLARELTDRGCEVVGVGRDGEADERISDLLSAYSQTDLTKTEEVNDLELSNIDAVVNLAGLAKVGESFEAPDLYMRVNVEVLSVLGEKILKDGLNIRVIAVSTGAVYDSGQVLPLTEGSNLVNETSPYVKSKLKMEETADALRRSGLDCVVARPFNHSGPEQEPGFLLPDLYEKIRQAKDTGESIKVGNLNTKRDYTDVRDVVKAYANLALSPLLDFNLYNICSGRSISGEEILSWLQKALGTDVIIEKTPALIRPNDPLEIYGSYKRLAADTGWKPEIPIQQTIKDIVESKLSPSY